MEITNLNYRPYVPPRKLNKLSCELSLTLTKNLEIGASHEILKYPEQIILMTISTYNKREKNEQIINY